MKNLVLFLGFVVAAGLGLFGHLSLAAVAAGFDILIYILWSFAQAENAQNQGQPQGW